jgi:hypothetical protein
VNVIHTSSPVEDGTDSVHETSAFNTQTPGEYPEDNLSLQHGESLKTRINLTGFFITETKCVYCAVRAESLHIIHVNCGLFFREDPDSIPGQVV